MMFDSPRPLEYWRVIEASSKVFEINPRARMANMLILATDGMGLTKYFILRIRVSHNDLDYVLRSIPKAAAEMIIKEYSAEMIKLGQFVTVHELADIINNDLIEVMPAYA